MNSLADGLPPNLAQQVHPDWRKNESGYWTVRDQLLGQYKDQWIGFADGNVIIAAPTPLQVFLGIRESKKHPFVIRVGHEDEPWYRIRRETYSYDAGYSPNPLPVMNAEFRVTSGTAGIVLDRVIPDTGSDTTTLPWRDCQQLGLDQTYGTPGAIAGVSGGRIMTMGYLIWVWIDGQEYPCQVQTGTVGYERILGRDVLNRLDILFRGPAGEVVVNP